MSMMGTRVVRREDPRLLRGEGTFVGDLTEELGDALVVSYVRSSFAHGRIVGIDLSDTLTAPGVVAAFTAADLDMAPPRPRVPFVPVETVRPWLAIDRVRFVGEPVAIVVTERADQAEDALETVIVDIDPLEAVVDPFDSLTPGAPLLFDLPSNEVSRFGPDELDESLFDGCEVVVSADLVNQRLAAAPLEGRASAARWDDGRLTFWISSQGVHGVKPVLAHAFGVEAAQVRVIAPDVGGGFGAKISPYPEDLLVGFVARRLGRPARWVETRSENMVAMGHGRDQRHRVTIGGTRSGRVEAYRLEIIANGGAYPTMGAGFLPTFTRLMAPGTYDIERVETVAIGVVTNTMSVEAYRGAGRPEATAAIERALDLFAAELGRDAAEVRRANLLPAHTAPITTVTGAQYDAGDYVSALDTVLAAADYPALRAEQARRRSAGETPWLGIGVSTYVEITAGGGPPTEFASVRIDLGGGATVLTGSSPHGQGLHTALTMITADRLGIDPADITVIHGDTDRVPSGGGTMGSRSLQLGGSAVHVASLELVENAKGLAADHLEAAVEDILFGDGQFSVIGTPSKSVGWAELADAVRSGAPLGDTGSDPLTVQTKYTAEGQSFPYGAHVSVVEVDPETGAVRLIRHVACDDAGVILNPLLADGQRHGGIAQGAAQALLEEVRFDEYGNPQTSNFADYTIISACELPSFELVEHVTPSPLNPLGAKGIGESGTIGSTPAVQSAVVDAVAHLGVRHIDMPCTPERVWSAIQTASALETASAAASAAAHA